MAKSRTSGIKKQLKELEGRMTSIHSAVDGSTVRHLYPDNFGEPAIEVRVRNDCSYKYVDIPGSDAKGLVPVKERRRHARKP